MHGTGILDAGLGDVYSLLHATGTCIYRSAQIGCNRRGVAVVGSWVGLDELCTPSENMPKENFRNFTNTDYIVLIGK